MSAMSQKQRLQQAAALIRQHHRIVAFTGAGISTESGIPDLDGIDQILKRSHKFAGNVFRFLDPKEAIADHMLFTKCTGRHFANRRHVPIMPIKR